MSQITNGIRAILNSPQVYDLLQNIMGAHTARRIWVRDQIRPFPGCRMLDIGCGTARILDYLPNDIEYHGFDMSQRYIESAVIRYGNRGSFNCGVVDQSVASDFAPFDLVMATSVLHHLDDESARALFRLAMSTLKTNGRLITLDPCFAVGQNFIARYLVSNDRGQNVRDLDGYLSLARSVFPNTTAVVRHQKWIPYTHCVMESTK